MRIARVLAQWSTRMYVPGVAGSSILIYYCRAAQAQPRLSYVAQSARLIGYKPVVGCPRLVGPNRAQSDYPRKVSHTVGNRPRPPPCMRHFAESASAATLRVTS